MGFVKDVFPLGAVGLAANAFGKKKKPVGPTPMIQMSNASAAPTSMIGSTRGIY